MDSFYSSEELQGLGLKSYGHNVKLSRKASIYMPETISIANNVRIDDFCCLVGGERGIEIGSYVHIAFHCILVGNAGIIIRDFAGLSSRVALYSVTDDYSGSFLTNPTVPKKYLNILKGEILLNKHVIVGTGSTILPGVNIGIGCSIGAHSLVTGNLGEWGVYVGIPAKRIKERNRDLLELEQDLILKYGL